MTQITHVVLVAWKNGHETADARVGPALRELGRSVPGIVSLVEGRSSSPEGKEDGYDYGFVITFKDASARDAYLPHPHHQVVAGMIGDHAERVLVFDV
ncbi:Dabb family protein [Auraticoccus monumenti]|uniref:Stress responsive A/B Barrel Domain n=1 Tax=Auraticoccus monumenti TaxID=675864 RepID=A0A1G6WMT2_9ACTN|nr:Dabb family protein [Auraticoccus monumenti]SDD67121.1 Stress responsive A/B Barrel Domain [Auraticoccus monumenti]